MPSRDTAIPEARRIADETGTYPAGTFVWLPEDSIHTPWAEGETVVLVLWPGGVKIEDASIGSGGGPKSRS